MTRWITTLITTVLLMPVLAAPAAALTSEASMVELVNGERTFNAMGSLTVHPDLVAAARKHAQAMADRGSIFHSADLASIGVTGWTLLGENVAMAPTVESAHKALMNSASHRANILEDSFTHIGIGIVEAKGTLWIVQMFMASKVTASVTKTTVSTTARFTDVAASVHKADIYLLADSKITKGCAVDRYCPHGVVTRAQIASFLVRAMGLSRTPFDIYGDDSTSVHQADINAAAVAGVVTGCAANRYCPSSALTRADMAVFLVRALDLPAASKDYFSDDDGWAHEAAINALAEAGITNGCTATRYCPGGTVTRAQMASYLVRAFGI